MINSRNYAIVFFGGVLVFSVVCWFAYGKSSSYEGPVIEIEAVAVSAYQDTADEEGNIAGKASAVDRKVTREASHE